MHVARSSDAADWIVPRLHPFAADVGSFIPEGFEAYARILHPPLKRASDGRIIGVRWQEIAAANDRSVEEEVLLVDESGDPTQLGPSGEAMWDEQSHVGSLSPDIAERLIHTLSSHTETPAQCWYAVWEGWGDVRNRWRTAPTLSIPGREMLLFEGTIGDALFTFAGVDWSYRSANLWWPDDRSWFVSTEIDFKWTYVGGSRECIAQLLSDPLLEVFLVTPTTIR